jgi:hypothetical protein
MSKKIRLHVGRHLLVVLGLLAIVAVPHVIAQRTSPSIAPESAKSLAIVAATESVLKETSEIRQLPVLYPVKSGAQSRDDIERMVIKNLDEETKPEKMRASELALKKLGLVPADFKYRSFIISLLGEQVAGYYDPKAKQFYLADWIAVNAQLPVMSHELTHALQDQHFNLGRFRTWPDGDGDAELAAHALVEGDATLVMMRYILIKPERMRDFMSSMSGTSAAANEKMESAPRVLRETLLFPYDQGLQFVTKLYATGGWKSVSDAYSNLPKSTEQILHPDKYLSHEAAVKVDMPDISKTLGKGWKRIEYDVNGEWGYYLFIDEYLKSAEQSQTAAAGWGGDRYAVYEGPAGEVMMAQLTVWDTEKDANEFYAGYVERTKLRYEPAAPVEVAASIQTPIRQMTMETTEGRVLVAQSGSRVLILEGVPNRADMKAIRSAILRSR